MQSFYMKSRIHIDHRHQSNHQIFIENMQNNTQKLFFFEFNGGFYPFFSKENFDGVLNSERQQVEIGHMKTANSCNNISILPGLVSIYNYLNN